jgi:hypothetical protein
MSCVRCGTQDLKTARLRASNIKCDCRMDFSIDIRPMVNGHRHCFNFTAPATGHTLQLQQPAYTPYKRDSPSEDGTESGRLDWNGKLGSTPASSVYVIVTSSSSAESGPA